MTENILEGIDTIVYNDKMWKDIKAVANNQTPPFRIPFGIKVIIDKYLPYEVVLLLKDNKVIRMIKLLDKKQEV